MAQIICKAQRHLLLEHYKTYAWPWGAYFGVAPILELYGMAKSAICQYEVIRTFENFQRQYLSSPPAVLP